jgi:hypothetical protein
MMWGRLLNKALRAAGVPSTFTKRRDLAAYRGQWRFLSGARARGTVHAPPKHPRDIWAQAGRRWPTALQHRPHGDGASAPTAPTATHQGSNPELTATRQWLAVFMGDRAFARARAVGKSETEAGHARAKAEANIAFSLPEEYGD